METDGLGPMQRSALATRAMQLPTDQHLDGFYCALSATVGRSEMERVRALVEHRMAGGTDPYEAMQVFIDSLAGVMEPALRALDRVAGALASLGTSKERNTGERS